MIAFDTRIEADPPLSMPSVSASAGDAMPCRRSTFHGREQLSHWIRFLNNQGREVTLWKQRGFGDADPGNLWAMEVIGVGWFWWTAGEPGIDYQPEHAVSDRLIEYWLLHLVLPVRFACIGRFHFVHAGAVLMDGGAVLLTADSHGGKSTLTDRLLKRGHPLISDDKVGLYRCSSGLLAAPSYPYHRPYRRTEDLGKFVDNFCPRPVSVRAMFELRRAAARADVQINELRGVAKFKALHHARDITLSFLRHSSFRFLSRAAGDIAVFQLSLPWDIQRLAEVCERIESHIEQGQAVAG